MNSVLNRGKCEKIAEDRHAEQQHADADDHSGLHKTDDDVGNNLASMNSTGVIGIEREIFHRPRSISRVTESAVKISIVIVRIVPTNQARC